MLTTIRFKLEGLSPILFRNGALADPLTIGATEIAKITGQQKRTREDLDQMAFLEWTYSLYLDDKERIVVPGANVIGMVWEAAKKAKLGTAVRGGVVEGEPWFPLIYEGPKTLPKLYADRKFSDRRPLKLPTRGSPRVIRVRPRFFPWGVEFHIYVDPAVLTPEKLIDVVKTHGPRVGICDSRPIFGKFTVTEAEVTNGGE